MKNLKLFSMIVLVAILSACGNTTDPTVIKFTSADNTSVAVNGELNFDVTVKVTNGKGETTFVFEGLPEWVTKTEGTDKVTLKGTAPTEENYSVTIKATNNKETTTQNFKIKVGNIPNVGEGTEENPYSVADAIAKQGGLKWVRGFIVGYVKTSVPQGSDYEWLFTADGCDNNTMITLAASANETDQTKCLPVQLPTGAIRTGLNLITNSGLLKKEVLLYGSLEKYFDVPGLKNTSYAKLIESGTEFGTKPVETGDAILNETLTTQASFNKFTEVSVLGTEKWHFDSSKSSYGAQMSGYTSGASHENEDWFISPAMDLTGKSNVVITFEHARGPEGSMSVPVSNYTLWITTNYTSGSPSTATWTQLTIPTHGTAAWGFVSSGNITIPSDKLSSTTRFAFKYVCNNTESATWEVKNVVVK